MEERTRRVGEGKEVNVSGGEKDEEAESGRVVYDLFFFKQKTAYEI